MVEPFCDVWHKVFNVKVQWWFIIVYIFLGLSFQYVYMIKFVFFKRANMIFVIVNIQQDNPVTYKSRQIPNMTYCNSCQWSNQIENSFSKFFFTICLICQIHLNGGVYRFFFLQDGEYEC